MRDLEREEKQSKQGDYYYWKQPFMMQFLSHSENILGKVPFHTTFQEAAQWAWANCLLLLRRVLVPLLLNALASQRKWPFAS